MPFKRRRLGKTDYNRRLKLLLSKKPRLVVRKSLKYIIAQIVEFDKKGDKVMLSVNSKQLKKLGWNFACDNLPAAYLTGLMIGKLSKEKKIPEAILDSGLYPSTKGSKVYATVKGTIDGGLTVPITEEILPTEDRISGKHIASYNENMKNLPEEFEKMKKKILGG
jgi:large subunit ribosomal protein L18